MTSPKLWHCYTARSLRALWALEEMGVDYELEVLAFPPRMFQREFLDVNPLGIVDHSPPPNILSKHVPHTPLMRISRSSAVKYGMAT